MPPEPPDSFAAYRSLDLLAEAVWPPAELVALAGWRCRLDRGVTRRANSVLATDWPGEPAESALTSRIEEVEFLYRDRALEPCFQVTSQAQPAELDASLAARGYVKAGTSLVQGCDLTDGSRRAAPAPEVLLQSAPSAGWLELLRAGGDPAAAAAKAAILARVAGAKVYLSIGPAEAPLAIGTGLRAGDTVWANNMFTAPDARGRGLAGGILAAIADWALAQGVTHLHLQVEQDNEPARRLYARFGFRPLYPYHYRILKDDGGGRAC